MNRNKRLQSRKCGSTIILAVFAVLLLLVIGTGLLSLGLSARIFAFRTASFIIARCAADAGLTKSVLEMNQKLKSDKLATGDWNADPATLPVASGESLPNCNATFSYILSGDINNGYIVESIGRAGQAEKKVKAILELRGLFEGGILAQDTIILDPKTLVDGYNSLDPCDTDVNVEVGTINTDPNSIVLLPGATVDGDVLIGIDADMSYVTPPDYLPDMGSIDVRGTILTIGVANSGRYSSIYLSHRAGIPGILEIDGGDVVLHVTGDIDIGQDCELVIKPGSSLTIYAAGNFVGGNSSGINNETMLPSNFVVYGTGSNNQVFDLKAKTDFYGAIYAPDPNIVIRAKGNVYGSFIGSSFEMKCGGDFYYDAALRDVGERFCIARWWEE